jgi:hypothetical protein
LQTSGRPSTSLDVFRLIRKFVTAAQLDINRLGPLTDVAAEAAGGRDWLAFRHYHVSSRARK